MMTWDEFGPGEGTQNAVQVLRPSLFSPSSPTAFSLRRSALMAHREAVEANLLPAAAPCYK